MEIEDIETSLSVPALIKDPIIKAATFFPLPTGGYEKFSGGYSVVFPCISNGQKWAFRCWYINDLGNVKDRYMKFAVDMRDSNLPYFCDFSYEDIGICVNGRLYPTTRMKWVEGQTIKEYMVQHKNEKDVLKGLAEKFYKMSLDMHKYHFAHGDLQHGNILVGNDENLYLVDYDSFYTPSLKGAPDIIQGVPDYQHPNRKDNLIENEKLDYFSELIIYTCILALAERPSFAEEYKLLDAERLFFSKEDYRNIKTSKIYNELISLGGVFPVLLKILVDYLSKDNINDLEPFEDLLVQYYKEPEISSFGFDGGSVIVKGEKALLSWNVENASEIYLNGERLEPTARYCEVKEKSVGTKSYLLHVVNGIKTKDATIDVQVVEGAVIDFLTDKKKLRKGKENSVNLSWNVRNAKEAFLRYNDKIESIPLKGSKLIRCDNTSFYEIDALDLDGKSHVAKKIKVEVCKECSIVFNADKEYTLPKVPVKLTWDVKDADEVKLDGSNVELHGEKIVTPDKETEYKLTANDAFGVTSKSVTVRMLPIPVIKSIMVPTPNIEKEITIQDNSPKTYIQLELQADNNTPKLDLDLPQFETPEPEFVSSILPDIDNNSTGNKFEFAVSSIKNKIKKILYHGKK